MRIDIIYNPASGRGRAERTALLFDRALRIADHTPRLRPVGQAHDSTHPPELLLLVGGDGTVKHALSEAIDLAVPVYHVPLGNENLFAREFAMDRDPRTLLHAIQARTIDTIDLGLLEANRHGARCTDRFSIMLSLGADASVIHRMDRDGRAASGHLAYLPPICDELVEPRIVPISARVDGRTLIDARPGLIVVANLRHYGFRVNPAAHADPRDALLDLVFIPASSVGSLLRAGLWSRLGQLSRVGGVVTARGREIELDSPGAQAQADGEALHLATPFRITAQPAALRVLRPPAPRSPRR